MTFLKDSKAALGVLLLAASVPALTMAAEMTTNDSNAIPAANNVKTNASNDNVNSSVTNDANTPVTDTNVNPVDTGNDDSANPAPIENIPQMVFQFGAFNLSQGSSQHIGINGLIGDQFTVAHHYDQNVLLGLGYYLNGLQRDRFNIMYGLNAFYLAHTTVEGTVIQENIFSNLSYHYYINNYPVYLTAKGFINMNSDKYNVTLDLGVGPNFIKTTNFTEKSLDGGVTLPDMAFAGRTVAVFSGMAGVGVKVNLENHLPIEIGYRFFYLGEGKLKKLNNQFQGTLNTGKMYANAIVISIGY